METIELHRLCGIRNLQKKTTPISWQPIRLKFIGAENYVLGTKRAEMSLTTRGGGFGMQWKQEQVVLADSLLGRCIKLGMLYDVVIEFLDMPGMPPLSLAELTGEMYPRVLRSGDTVRIA